MLEKLIKYAKYPIKFLINNEWKYSYHWIFVVLCLVLVFLWLRKKDIALPMFWYPLCGIAALLLPVWGYIVKHHP
ncbi:MAG: hypothetical protein K5853_09285, partial [Lachnospiraceae bacterium]|nr:hypothetical protein [Lachnospiraceae bacterium]